MFQPLCVCEGENKMAAIVFFFFFFFSKAIHVCEQWSDAFDPKASELAEEEGKQEGREGEQV